MASSAPSNSLGLDFDHLRIKDNSGPASDGKEDIATSHDEPPTESPDQQANDINVDNKERKKPYINPQRVKTGGPQRDKLSEEELSERMVRMKEQNEKIKQRRMDVKADEDAFKQTQESERVKQAQIRKIQEQVNRTRQQNERRKMDKIQSREWDAGKPSVNWKDAKKPTQEEVKEKEGAGSGTSPTVTEGASTSGFRGGRGSGRGRGGGTGRGSGGPVEANREKSLEGDKSLSAPAPTM